MKQKGLFICINTITEFFFYVAVMYSTADMLKVGCCVMKQ